MNDFFIKAYKKLPKWLKKVLLFINDVVSIFLANDIPIFAASSSFFLIISSIPIFMLMFSTISLIPQFEVVDLIENINLLFPNLPYVTSIVNYALIIARDLAKSNVIYINIAVAIITGSTCLFAFIVGIRKIHEIEYTSNYIILKILTVINMLVLYLTVIITLIMLILGKMILGYVKIYFPFAAEIIDKILSYRYLVSSIVLVILTMSLYTTSTNFERSFLKNIYGSIFATIAWLTVSNAFSFYFTKFPMNTSTYGSLSGIIVVLFWIFICINIVFLGACVNEVAYPQSVIVKERRNKIE